MTKRKGRAGANRGRKKDNRPIQDIVQTQLMFRFSAAFFAQAPISQLEAIQVSEVADYIPVCLIDLDGDASQDVINRAKTLAIKLRHAGIAVVINAKIMDGFEHFDGVHLSSFELTSLENTKEDEEAPKPSKSTDIEKIIAVLSEDEYFGCGPISSLEKALAASELGAAYIWLEHDDRSKEIDMLNWWSDMVEVPSVAMAADDGHLEKLANLGVDFALITIQDIQGQFTHSFVQNKYNICRDVYMKRSSATQ